jgi:hypothetical protein
MSWHAFKNGSTIGQRGSEEGIILLDDEHEYGARITLERAGAKAPFAITCGIYDWMVHTRFLSQDAEARQDFDAMKAALDRIVRTIPLVDDPDCKEKSKAVPAQLAEFVAQFP